MQNRVFYASMPVQFLNVIKKHANMNFLKNLRVGKLKNQTQLSIPNSICQIYSNYKIVITVHFKYKMKMV